MRKVIQAIRGLFIKKYKEPEILYKYRDWGNEYHKRILTHREIFIPSPISFNDPFDCMVTYDLRTLNTRKKKKRYIDAKVSEHFHRLETEGVNIEEKKREMLEELEANIDAKQDDWENIWFNSLSKRFGIFSLAKIWDSILMWGHYANNHTGICIGLDTQRLIDSRIFGKGGEVMYMTKYPYIDPAAPFDAEMGIKETHSKLKDWEYEQEYRLHKFYNHEPTNAERTFRIPKTFYKEIILGLNFPDAGINEVKALAQAFEAKLYRIVKVNSEFRIVREEIPL